MHTYGHRQRVCCNCCSSVFSFFFFSSRRRHTRLQGDWSSDVCSSDLYCFSSGVTSAACLWAVWALVFFFAFLFCFVWFRWFFQVCLWAALRLGGLTAGGAGSKRTGKARAGPRN